ncbi:transposase [Herbivorax sp. ANBcel31]|uniref:transposase n=1 Tax=Herbivorax sp. ANBcel31 TaxID=3069754 RepID=UPI0027B4FDB6|nr:transposase [Herbivorax sp. ANBcel31]MDQ2085632.1 transposase [Herbivorax sp. ANBcel31]
MNAIKTKYPVVLYLTEFLNDCYHVFDTGEIEGLDFFLNKYKNSKYEPVKKYANSLIADYSAVKNSLIYKNISNGPLEAHNNRIKFKHRKCGGRAGLNLLNAYFVLSDYNFE